MGDYETSARLPDNRYHLSCLLQKKLPFKWQNHGSSWSKDVINQCFEFGVVEVMMLINDN